MEKRNPLESASVRALYFSLYNALKKVIQERKDEKFPFVALQSTESHLFEEITVIVMDETGNAEIHVKPKVAIQKIDVTIDLRTPKYKVYNSALGTGWHPAYTDDEAWDLVGKGHVGRLYEVRYWDTDALVPEFVPL